MDQPDFDLQDAHRYFSASCYNAAWDLIEKKNRSKQEDDEMIRLGLAATWHWTQRADVTDTNLSIGYWQASRIYAILGQVENARQYGQTCLELSQKDGVPPFYLGFAYEALARSESIAGNVEASREYLRQAVQIAGILSDEEEKRMLMEDLNELENATE
jgi:tetratricopeptide (TPR) repeat protein